MTAAARAWSSRAEVSRRARLARHLRALWTRAYQENITGLAGMVAYNLVLALFPFALLVLFVFGQILQSGNVETSVLNDLQRRQLLRIAREAIEVIHAAPGTARTGSQWASSQARQSGASWQSGHQC